MRRTSEFKIRPEEELDLQHQGSLGGDQLKGKYGRGVESNISTQRGTADLTARPKHAEGTDVAASPSQKRSEQRNPERTRSEVSQQEESSPKHHYK